MRLRDSSSRPAVVLIAVLIVVVLLSLAAYKYNDLMTAEYRATDSSFRAAQARAYAVSGVNYTAALLSTNLDDTAGGNPWDNSGLFQSITVPSSAKNGKPGRFSVLSLVGSDDAITNSQGYRFGLCDEASKINVNSLLLLGKSGKGGSSGGGSAGAGSSSASSGGTSSGSTPSTATEPGMLVLMQLPNMTADVANAILDWIDPNDPQRTSGAKETYYSALSPPYHCKNGPLDSLEEMLLIKGVTPQLLFGSDKNRNGQLDPGEDGSGQVDLGWSAYLTVHSREANYDNTNQPRVYLNDSDLDTMANGLSAATINEDLVTFIIAARLYGVASNTVMVTLGSSSSGGTSFSFSGSFSLSTPPLSQADKDAIAAQIATDREKGDKKLKAIKSLWSLINAKVDVKITDAKTGKVTTKSLPSPLNVTDQQRTLLPPLLDKCTVTDGFDLVPRLNINTASKTVLNAFASAFPQLDAAAMQTIIDKRPTPTDATSDPIYKTHAWLLTEAKLDVKTIKLIEPYITTRAQVYRFQAVGYAENGGPVSRIEAVVDANQGRPRIVYWRDLSELGKGFDINAAGN